MSTAKSLVDAQCGQANPLVQLSQNFSQNNAKVATGVERQLQAVMPSISTGDAVGISLGSKGKAFLDGSRVPIPSGQTNRRSGII